MDYKNFEYAVNPFILENGKAYFDNGAVNDLEKDSEKWTAKVDGTTVYATTIKGIESIKAWNCDCPYSGGPVCKHVIAVLYAIRAIKTPDI